MKNKTRLVNKKAYSPRYIEKKPFFSEKEIIFRSAGRAKVFKISSRLQVIVIALVCCICTWSIYSYHMYNKSGRIINHKDRELVETRDAYVDLMSDFVSIQKNIDSVLEQITKKGGKTSSELDRYKRQAMAVEDKIKHITATKSWADDKKISEKMSFNEVLLQRDMAISERDELRKQLDELEDAVRDIKAAEMDVFSRVEALALREISKIKSAFNSINVPIKRQGLYFNPLANSKKKNSRGGVFVPASVSKLQDKEMSDKVSKIYKAVDDLEYYREVVQYVPLGKPVWSYWMSSKFGYRSDPFNKKKAGHKGVDLASRTGNKILVKAKGRVVKVEYSKRGYGNNLTIDHGNGFKTRYAHMNKIYVKKGDYLNVDDVVGEVGNTGRSTGPHLHYEIIYNGRPVDPLPFMQAKAS
ncbi:MAG: peptidoglycan DD-metalloendopeptidase family protein [Alphaproteobacteria bacterium]|nr:peptidoglycan DD-metalloendopeptidase family protein [Alphaproteobacteria bacterium]